MHIRQLVQFSLTMLVLFGMFVAQPAFAVEASRCAPLPRSLKEGMSGSDVHALQKLLNANIATRIAISGSGAPGEETAYFGVKTVIAVKIFQTKHKEAVLVPAGLTVASGYVGALTRAKLHALCINSGASKAIIPTQSPGSIVVTPPSPTQNPTTSSTNPSTAIVKPVVPHTTDLVIPISSGLSMFKMLPSDPLEFFYPSKYVIAPNETIQLLGRGFAETGNSVHVGSTIIPNVPLSGAGTLTVTVPTEAGKGVFDIWVSNGKGASNKRMLIVRDAGVVPPMILSYTPTFGALGTQVTVKGTGFTLIGNEIHVSNRTIKDVPSPDGATLQFSVDMPEVPGAVSGFDLPGVERTIPLWFYVANANGMSKNGVFSLKI